MIRLSFGQLSTSDAAALRRSPAPPRAPFFSPKPKLAVVACALLAACASPARPAASPAGPDDARWRLDDVAPPSRAALPMPALSSAVLEREAFVRAVLERNPSLEAARQGFRAASARERQAGAFEDPMVDLGVAPLSLVSSEVPVGFQVAVSQKLPWFGKRGLESEASRAEASAASNDYEAMKRELGLSAVMLYDDYFLAAQSLEINAAHVGLMHSIHDSAVAAFSAGRASEQDALEADAELTRLEQDAIVLTSQRDVTMARMNELLHRDPALPLPPPPGTLPLPLALDVNTAAASAAAIARRPDIVAVEDRARAEQARAERAERESYPDVTLSTSYSRMWAMPQHRWMVGVAFNVPLQLDRRAGAVDEARATRSELLREAARLTDAARTQAFVAVKQLEESSQVLELFEKKLLPLARQQIDAARAGFITSRNSFNVVVEAERNLRRVELDYQTQRTEYVRRRAELDRAVGRIPGLGWKERTP